MDKKVQMFIEQTEANVKAFSERFHKYKLQQIIKNHKIKKNNISAYVERLSNAYNTHLIKLKEIIQERNDKICGVCYDLEADFQLKCIHKLCEKCSKLVNKCPFCRMEFHTDSNYLKIDSDEPIEDVNVPFNRSIFNHSELLERIELLEHYILHRIGINSYVSLCSIMNEMLGRHLYYRQIINGLTVYKVNVNIPINLVVYFFLRTLRDIDTLSHENLRYLERRILMIDSDLRDRLNYYSPII